MSSVRIVTIIARLNTGGPARHVAWLVEGLRAENHQAQLVAGVVPPTEGDMSGFAEARGITPLYIQEMSREISARDVVTIWKLYKFFRRFKPDIIDTHTAKAGTVGRVAGFIYRWFTPSSLIGRPRQVAFVHTFHGHVFHSYYGAAKTNLFLFIERALALMTHRIIVVSRQQFNEIHHRFKVGNQAQFQIVQYGLEAEKFLNPEARRDVVRDEIKAVEGDVIIGIVGRVTAIKNHQLFLNAVAAYKKLYGVKLSGGGQVRFAIVGDGELRAGLEAQAQRLGITDDVLFLGERDDIENLFAAFDIVALTSLNEGLPLVLIEAMLAQRPVVATQVGGVVDLLGSVAEKQSDFEICERGIGVRSGDAEGFAHALNRLIEDEDLRLKIAARGFDYAHANLTRERMIRDVVRIFSELV